MPSPITAVATSVTAFIGASHKGPGETAVHVAGFADYQKHFGPLDASSEMGFAAQQFFSNGGSSLYIVRIEPGGQALTAAFQALNKISVLNVLCLPGVTELSALSAARTYCQNRGTFLIIDAPASALTTQQLHALMNNSQLPRSVSAAIYAPWLEIPDPLQSDSLRTIAPSGAVAGIFARTDSASGVWKAPAGVNASLLGVSKLTANFSDADEQSLNNAGLNLLRSFPQKGNVVWGARTLAPANSDFKYVPVRRLALFLEQSISRGTQWVVFEPNGEPLWSQIRMLISAFLQHLFLQGAFQGTTPSRAYFVKCDSSNNTQADINQGILNIQIGFAPLQPAEFVIL